MLESEPLQYTSIVPPRSKSFEYLDHTVYLANGILTCPYPHAVNPLINSIEYLCHSCTEFTIRKIDNVTLHAEGTVPLLIDVGGLTV